MNKTMKQVIYVIGLITVVYLLFKYVLPIILKALGIILSTALSLAIVIIIVFLIFYVANYIIKKIKN